jgi:hypothetical protein
MAKRAAEVQPQSAKVARTANSASLAEEHAALALVSSATEISEECRAMLQAMAPYCSGTTIADKHAYQEEMVHVLSGVCFGVESKQRAAVVSAEANLADAKVDAEKLEARLAGLEQEVLGIRGMCEGKSASAKSAADGVASAQQAVSAEEKRAEAIAGERACAEIEREEYEGVLQDTLARLREGVVSSKQRREHDKLLKSLLDILCGLGVDRSLLDALRVALKTKAEARGVFANLAVTCADEALQKHIALLSDKVDSMGLESTKCAEILQRAQEALAVAQSQQSSAIDEQVAAENTLQEAESRRQGAAASVRASKVEVNRCSVVLDESCVESKRVSELLAQFVEWRDGPKDAPAASVAVAELPMATTGAVVEAEGVAEATSAGDKSADMTMTAVSALQAAEVAGA